jgi:hypothetical protein
MITITEFIAGESLTLDNITYDNADSTPFPSDYVCYAEVYKRSTREQLGGRIDADTRVNDTDPFVISITPDITSSWIDWIIILVTVENSEHSLVGKTKLEVHCEQF